MKVLWGNMDNPRRLANFLMRSRSGAELWHRCKVRNIAKVSAAILSIEWVSGAPASEWPLPSLWYFRTEYHSVRSDVSALERGLHLRILSGSIRRNDDLNSRPITIRLSACQLRRFQLLRERKTPSLLTRMTERKGERLCLGIFNVRSLYKKVPRRRSTYVKIPIDANMTHKFSRDGRGSNVGDIIEKNTPLLTITFQVNKSMLLCRLLMIPRPLYPSYTRSSLLYRKLIEVLLKIYSQVILV